MSSQEEIQRAHDNIDRGALKGADEVNHFLDTYRGDDPVALARVRVATGAVKAYLEKFSSQNGLFGLMMGAAERAGVPTEQTLQIAKGAGLLPESTTSGPLRLRKPSQRAKK